MHEGPVVRAPCAATAMRVKKNPKELSEQEKVEHGRHLCMFT